MTTKELIEVLKKLDPKGERDVFLKARDDDGLYRVVHSVAIEILAEDTSSDPWLTIHSEEA